jgi:hypothetical protein
MEQELSVPASLMTVMNKCATCTTDCCGANAFDIAPIAVSDGSDGTGKTLLKEARREIAALIQMLELTPADMSFSWNNIIAVSTWWIGWLHQWDAALKESLNLRLKISSRPFEGDTAMREAMASRQKKRH